MKRILLLILVLVSIESFSQGWKLKVFKVGNVEYYQFSPPNNYSFINGRYRWLATMADSGMHIPSYNGTPVGTRVNVWPWDGAIAMDTTNHRFYIFSGNAWIRVANFSEVGATYTANLPIRITGTVISADTSVAFVPSLTTNARLQKIADSLGGLMASGNTIYTGNGTLAGNRQVTMDDKSLSFINSGENKLLINPTSDAYSFGDGDGTAAVIAISSSNYNTSFSGVTFNKFTYTGRQTLFGDVDDNWDGIKIQMDNSGVTKYGSLTFGDTTHILIDDANHFFKFSSRQSERVRLNMNGILIPNGIMPTTGSGGTDSAIFRNSSSGQFYLAPGGGGGSNFANADLTFTGDRFHELNDFELDITNNNIWSQFFIDGQNRRYSLGDNSAEGNGRAILIRDTATVTPGYMMPAMQQATTSNVLYYNTTTGGITYDAAPGGSVDTVNANAGSVTSNQRFYAKIDSLSAAGWNPNNINHSTRYQHYLDKTSSTYGGFYWTSSGTGSTVTGITTSAVPLGFLYAHSIETGTTTTGLACHYTHQNGTYAALALSSTIRYNFGIRMRLEDLSDGTDTYEYYAGFMDNITGSANIVDGAYFTYTHSASSGQWVCHAENNNTVTSTASGITVAADTNYELEVTVFGGSAYFYIDKVLVATIATNVPDDDVNRITSAGDVIIKSAGTTSRKAYVDWLAFGRQNQ